MRTIANKYLEITYVKTYLYTLYLKYHTKGTTKIKLTDLKKKSMIEGSFDLEMLSKRAVFKTDVSK